MKHVDNIISALHNTHITIKLKKCKLITQKVRYIDLDTEPGRLYIKDTVSKSLKEAETERNKQEK